MKRWLPYLGIAFGVALVVYAVFFGKNEEERIRQRLHQLEDSVAVDGAENPVLRAARLRKELGELVTHDVRIAIPELDGVDSGRNQLVELAAAAPQQFKSARIDLEALRIRLDDPKEHAVAVGDAKLAGTRQDGEREQSFRTVSLRLDKLNGEWRIVDVSVSPPKDPDTRKK